MRPVKKEIQNAIRTELTTQTYGKGDMFLVCLKINLKTQNPVRWQIQNQIKRPLFNTIHNNSEK